MMGLRSADVKLHSQVHNQWNPYPRRLQRDRAERAARPGGCYESRAGTSFRRTPLAMVEDQIPDRPGSPLQHCSVKQRAAGILMTRSLRAIHRDLPYAQATIKCYIFCALKLLKSHFGPMKGCR